MTSLRHDHVSPSFAGLYELEVHGAHGAQILRENLLQGASAGNQVALDAANEPNVRVGIDVNLHVTELAHASVDEQQNPVDDDDVGRLNPHGFRPPAVGDEVVHRLFDGL